MFAMTAPGLACPKCKEPLIYFEAERFLLCPSSQLRFRIDDNGVAVLLLDDATPVMAEEVDRLVKLAKDLGLPGA